MFHILLSRNRLTLGGNVPVKGKCRPLRSFVDAAMDAVASQLGGHLGRRRILRRHEAELELSDNLLCLAVPCLMA